MKKYILATIQQHCSLLLILVWVFVSPAHTHNLQLTSNKNRSLSSVPACTNFFSGSFDSTQIMNPNARFINMPRSEQQTRASWEHTRYGLNQILDLFEGYENAVYYLTTAMLSADHILIDGSNGAGKTAFVQALHKAQLNALNSTSVQEMKRYIDSRLTYLKELLNVIQTEPQVKRSFMLQGNEGTIEAQLIGAINLFSQIKNNDNSIEYSKALIQQDNIFAIIDEIHKIPPDVQMTLLSVLADRVAMHGNEVIQLHLESLTAITNATTAELISQGESFEVGGRQALLDRFRLKFYMVNTTNGADETFSFIVSRKNNRGKDHYHLIDLRGLRHLINQVQIPAEVLDAALDLEQAMTLHYKQLYNDAREEAFKLPVINGQVPAPKYFPPYSGSTRTVMAIPHIWRSAFLIRQLMMGVPYESLRKNMQFQDLVDLAPVFLHGGPDFIIPKFGFTVRFLQKTKFSSMSSERITANRQLKRKKAIPSSFGHYDPNTQIFSYVSATTKKTVYVYFNKVTKQLEFSNPESRNEVILNASEIPESEASNIRFKRFDLNNKLAEIQERFDNKKFSQKKLNRTNSEHPIFQILNRIQGFISNPQVKPEVKEHLEKIYDSLYNVFLSTLNKIIASNQTRSLTPLTIDTLGLKLPLKNGESPSQYFSRRNQEALDSYRLALENNDVLGATKAAAIAIQRSVEELNFFFRDSSESIRGIMTGLISELNVMYAGAPGSAKTALSRVMLNMVIKSMSEAQKLQLVSFLAKKLTENLPEITNEAIYIKQFNPATSEQEIVGRLDIKALADGKGYSKNRNGTLASDKVIFVLLDEWDKASERVKTAANSVANERKIFDGHEVINLAVQSIILNTNSSKSEFLRSMGKPFDAIPFMDRVQVHINTPNKNSKATLFQLLTLKLLGISGEFKGTLPLDILKAVSRDYNVDDPSEVYLLSEIHTDFMNQIHSISNAMRVAHSQDPESQPDFLFPTRGESKRTAESIIVHEFPRTVILNRVLSGRLLEDLNSPNLESKLRFDIEDLAYFAQQYLTYNNQYKLVFKPSESGFFEIIDIGYSRIEQKLDEREISDLTYIRREMEVMKNILNTKVREFMQKNKDKIAQNPELYPSLFATTEARIQFGKEVGLTEEEINQLLKN